MAPDTAHGNHGGDGMAGLPGRSGGHNKISIEEHLARGTYRQDRHGPRDSDRVVMVTRAERQRVLKGLTPGARVVASRLLASYGNWNAAMFEVLRAYALSCDRLEQLQAVGTSPALHSEVRTNLALLRTLGL